MAVALATHVAALAEPQPVVLVEGLGLKEAVALMERNGLRPVNFSVLSDAANFKIARSVAAVSSVAGEGRPRRDLGDASSFTNEGRSQGLFAAAALPPEPQRGPLPRLEPGWEPLTIEKTDEEKEAQERIYGPDKGQLAALKREVRVPAARDTFGLTLGQGYVQGADWGTDAQGSGRVAGYRMDFWSQSTMGPEGFEMRAGRFTVASPDSRWTAQGGDLVSDIWGWGRGGRLIWQSSDWHAPTLSYYERTQRRGEARNVLAVTDYLRLRPWLAVGGEVASDGSYMFRPRLRTKRVSVMPYYRLVPNENRSRGIYGSLAVWKRASLFAGYTHSIQVGAEQEWLDFGLRVPLPRGVNVTLQRTRSHSTTNRNAVNALSVSLPVGKLRIFARYQHRDTDLASRSENFGFFGFRQHEFFGGATYSAGKRLSLSMQTASRWRRDGAIDQWQQITGLYRFSRKASLETISVLPDATTPSQHRARFIREINADWALVLEYGNLSPYQSIELDLEDERFKILVRRRFKIPTPAVGGDVDGVVSDALGYALQGVLVRLGPYATITDAEGRYQFRYVPEGEYALSVDDKSIPANYVVTEPPRMVQTGRRTAETSDWTVIPLNTVAGRVCAVHGPRDACDAESGVADVAVYLDGRVTATREGGLFLFHNVPPGRHRLALGLETIPEGMAPNSKTETFVEVEPGKRVDPTVFTLQEIQRSVVFQTLDEE
ncbi:MAG: carboxypeptidase-like regulatory domain-containing protein [Bryobacterales bacterium]